MEKRPKIKVKLNLLDWCLELTSLSVLLVFWLFVLQNYHNLPDTIPIHYNASGEADRFGDKSNLLILPIIVSVLYLILTALNQFPHVFNYPTEINADNAERQYKLATRLVRFIKIFVVVLFATIAYETIYYVQEEAQTFGKWFMPAAMVLIFAAIVFYLVSAYKSKSDNRAS